MGSRFTAGGTTVRAYNLPGAAAISYIAEWK